MTESEADIYRTDVLVSTTWGCNLKCSYCFVQENDLAGTKDQMSPALAASVIDFLDTHLSKVKYKRTISFCNAVSLV